MALSYFGVWSLTHGYVAYPDWISGHFFNPVEDPAGLAAMSSTLGTAWVAIQCYALSAIAIAVLQGAGFTRHAFWIELMSVSVYIGCLRVGLGMALAHPCDLAGRLRISAASW